MDKLIQVTIGIPAYNEEANILRALSSIFSQKDGTYRLNKVIIISDGSTDSTVSQIKSFDNKKAIVYPFPKRKGKAFRLNQIFKLSSSEILILMDADCTLAKNAVSEMIKVFKKDASCVFVAGNATPVKPKYYFEKVVNVGVTIRKHVARKIGCGQNVYLFHGSLMGLKKKFYKKISIPASPGTDAYLYFKAKKESLKSQVSEKAKVFYILPNKLMGHFKQSSRFLTSQKAMSKFFGTQVLCEYNLPANLVIFETMKQFLYQPIYTLNYLFLNSLIKLMHLFNQEEIKGTWDIALSTKRKI